MDPGLQGKTVLVTGGSRGIGRAIAVQCAAEGADVAICARAEAGLTDALDLLRKQGTQVFGCVADVTRSDEAELFLQASAEALGGIDILIDNVGGSGGKGLLREEFPFGRLATPEEIARVVAFVASPAGSWIHGAMIPVNGGQQHPSAFQRGPIWK